MLKPKHIRKLRDELVEHPATANKRLKALKALFAWAVEEDEAEDDPTTGVKKIAYVERGHPTWSDEEITIFEQRHPIGTKPRLAMALMLNTGCRREDVVRLGPQHINDGRLRYIQGKNEHRNPVEIDIPVHAHLQNILAATPSQHLTFLVTEYGRPFSCKGFGARFKDWCCQAGLPHLSSHGLRKAAGTRLAEAHATPHEIMAVLGHKTLKQVERYTEAVRKRQLADSAIARLKK
jgi:integrase